MVISIPFAVKVKEVLGSVKIKRKFGHLKEDTQRIPQIV